MQRATEIPDTVAMILDSDSTILASSSSVLKPGTKATSYAWFAKMAEETIRQQDSMHNYEFNSEKKMHFAHRINIADKEWYFSIGVSRNIVFAELERTIHTAITTALSSVIISMLLAFVILHILYRPIVQLKNTILGLSSGDGELTQRLEVTTDDDLGQIAQAVNQFIDKIMALLVHKDASTAYPLSKDEQGLNELGDSFTQRWKDAFEQYRYRINREEELREELKLDALTRLPTRSYFEILLGEAIREVYSEKSRLLLVSVNLGNYDTITENFTYQQTQDAIVQLVDIITNKLPQRTILSRTAQAEFSIILKDSSPDISFIPRVQQLASQLRSIDTEVMAFRCKFGATTLAPEDEKPTVSGLFYRVNNALYSINSHAAKNYAFFHKEQDIEKAQRQSLSVDFRSALRNANDELQLYFQPQINIVTQVVRGAEALIRWQHPEKGFLTPDRFVYIVEDDIQLNIEFGEWLIESALRKLSQRSDSLTLSVNITPSHLQREDFYLRLSSLLEPYPVEVAQRLKIELTETASISDHERVEASMRSCRALGVHFSLDDFGTGYSTLSQLRSLPATELKIDRSFVQHLEDSEEDQKMVSTMIMLANSFDIGVVVEGVENREQENILKELGCNIVQGYYYARPIPYNEFNQWLSTRSL